MKIYTFILWMLMCTVPGAAQPYFGVSKNFPEALLATDPSVLKEVVYVGINECNVFDRRVNKSIMLKAYVFKAIWENGGSTQVIINPEVGTMDAAAGEARKYAVITGRLPFCLRRYIDRVVIHAGDEAFGGGNRGLLFYTGKTRVLEEKGTLEEIVVHEAAHNLGQEIGSEAQWLTAQEKDTAFISEYARKFPLREDVSESFLAWLIVRYYKNRITPGKANTISTLIPARLQYFDEQQYDVHPVKINTP